MSVETNNLWTLVQFVEDGVWFASPPSRFKELSSNECEVKWPRDGKWYPAVIYARSDERTIKAALNEVLGNATSKKKSLDNILLSLRVHTGRTKRRGQPHSKKMKKCIQKSVNTLSSKKTVKSVLSPTTTCNDASTKTKCTKLLDSTAVITGNTTYSEKKNISNCRPSEIPSTNDVLQSIDDIHIIENSTIIDFNTTTSHPISILSDNWNEQVEHSSSTFLVQPINSEDFSLSTSIAKTVIDSTNDVSQDVCSNKNLVIAQECPSTSICSTGPQIFTFGNVTHETVPEINSNSINTSEVPNNLDNSDILILSQIDNSFISKYGIENASELSMYPRNTSSSNFDSTPNNCLSPQDFTDWQKDNSMQQSQSNYINLKNLKFAPLQESSALEDLTNISKTNDKFLQEKNPIADNDFFSEEEPFIDSGSEYRPSTSYSEDTDGDSFRKSINLQDIPRVSNTVITQVFDFSAPQSAYSSVTLSPSNACREEFESSNISSHIENSITNLVSISNENHQICSDNIENSNERPNSEIGCSIATVSTSKNRRWDKRYFCVYCKKTISKLPRHLYSHHREEPEVVKILNLNKNSKDRKKLIAELQNRGAFLYNTTVIRRGNGLMIPKRRPRINANTSVPNYIPCPFCFQLFAKSYLSEHKNKCLFTEGSMKGARIQASSLLLLPVGPEISSRFKDTVLSKMVVDEVFFAIRKDWLILKFGEWEFQKLGHEHRYLRNISDRMRELGRLLIAAGKIDSYIKKFAQLISPSKYQLIKNSVRMLAGFNEMTNSFQSPSLVLKLGISLKKCGILLKGEYMEDDDLRPLISEIEYFLNILDAKWSREINCHAHRTLSERKWNAPKRLPLAKDIQILHRFLKLKNDEAFKKLQDSSDVQVFQELTEITLVRSLILNRRRVGEMQYILLSDYVKAKSADPESDVFQTLSSVEKELSKLLKRLVIKGKKVRGVPVLFTEDLQANLSLLIKLRDACGVKMDNLYLFPSLCSKTGHYRAHVLLRKYSILAGCNEVESITSTRLRKHIATMTQLLNLRDHELDTLAEFMGHDIRVHREYYRLSEETTQLAKISKLLISVDRGNFTSLKGKNLDQIDVEDLVEEIEESECGTDEEEDSSSLSKTFKTIDSDTIVSEPNIFPEENTEQFQTEKSPTHSCHTKLKKVTVESNVKRVMKTRNPWSSEEKTVTHKYFNEHLRMKILPGKKEIDIFLAKNSDLLGNRKWNNVKDFLYNEIKKT